MPAEPVPPRTTIEFSANALERARERLGLDEKAVREAAAHATRHDQYKDGLRLWHIDGGWLAVHEVGLPGGSYFRAVVVTALDDTMLAGWRPREAKASAPKRRAPSGPCARRYARAG